MAISDLKQQLAESERTAALASRQLIEFKEERASLVLKNTAMKQVGVDVSPLSSGLLCCLTFHLDRVFKPAPLNSRLFAAHISIPKTHLWHCAT